MAVRWAIASGNFSSTATWNNGAILGIPTSADDVWANGFTVNMDVNATVISLNTTSRARTIATPQMTANNAPSPFVAAASGLADSRQPFQAFDRSYDTVNNYWSAGWPGPQWVSIDFGSGNATIIDGYTIFGNSDATINPNTWQLQGSNDNISWTPLHSVSGSTIPSSGTYSIASIGNLLAYRYYRINVTAIGSGTGTRVRITEIELYQPGTAALAAGGSFNFNTAGVTVSATRTSQGASNLFTVTNTTGTTITVGTNPQSMAFDTNSNTLYVSNATTDNISVIDVLTNTVIKTITVGNFPRGVAYDTKYDRIYVENSLDNCLRHYESLWHLQMQYKEAFNFVKYLPGKYFKIHADHGPYYSCTISAVVYLNDDYEGGEIEFVRHGITIKPEAGDIIVFPSNFVYEHASLEIFSGNKYSVVIMTDYNDMHHKGFNNDRY
jgi:YVTN family beta-propeller protein